MLLAGCAGVAEVTGTATQQDILQLRSDLTVLQQSVQRATTEAGTVQGQLDRRLGEQAAESGRQTEALGKRLDGLAATLATLTTRIEEMSARLESLTRQVRAAPPTPARPATPPPAASATPPAGPAAPHGGTAPAPPATAAVPSRPTTGSLQPQDVYQAAYIDFSKGTYSLAIAGFREFLRRYPEHELADNAQYWIGEAYVSVARGYLNAGQADRGVQALEQAVQEFRRVVANHPRGDKTPTALYKEALVLIELKQPALAQGRLQYLVDNFPQAEETPLARERLAALKAR